MPAPGFALALFGVFISQVAGAVSFSSSPATDLQPLFNIAAPWLGADVATSLPLGGQAGAGYYLWLHGDTLIGSMSGGGVREWDGEMPRNSVAVLRVNASDGAPLSNYTHFLRRNTSNPVHNGFWSPPSQQQWYWPTAGVSIGLDVHVVAMRMEASGGGLFPFAMAGMDVLSFSSPSLDPLSWPQPTPSTLPLVNSTFCLGNAVTLAADGNVYILGSNNGSAFMARIDAAAFAAHSWGELTVWPASGGAWLPLGSAAPAALFDFTPSETTLTYHDALGLWIVVVANTFISDSIMIRTAASVTGPWSDLTPIYTIPPAMLEGAFC